MNFESFDRYPDLKQAVEDCYEIQEERTKLIIKLHPRVTPEQVAVELLYHLMLRLFWMGEPDFAANALIRQDRDRQARLSILSARILDQGLESVPAMVQARDIALQWGVLPGSLAEDIADMIEDRMSINSDSAETRLTRFHNEAAAAAARVEDLLGENVSLFVFGAAQTRDRVARGMINSPTAF